jgi:hypothetical protein
MSHVLICLKDAHARRQLADALTPQHECVVLETESAAAGRPFDVCVTDQAQHIRRPELLEASFDPNHPPAFLLILPREKPGHA